MKNAKIFIIFSSFLFFTSAIASAAPFSGYQALYCPFLHGWEGVADDIECPDDPTISGFLGNELYFKDSVFEGAFDVKVNGNYAYVVSQQSASPWKVFVRKIDIATGSLAAQSEISIYLNSQGTNVIGIDADGNVYVTTSNKLHKFNANLTPAGGAWPITYPDGASKHLFVDKSMGKIYTHSPASGSPIRVYDTSGSLFASIGGHTSSALQVDSSGDIYLRAGIGVRKINQSGNIITLWGTNGEVAKPNVSFGSTIRFIVDSAKNVYMSGGALSVGAGDGPYIHVRKYNALGQPSWYNISQTVPTYEWLRVPAIAIDEATGSIYTAGNTYNAGSATVNGARGDPIVITKHNISNGTMLWAYRFIPSRTYTAPLGGANSRVDELESDSNVGNIDIATVGGSPGGLVIANAYKTGRFTFVTPDDSRETYVAGIGFGAPVNQHPVAAAQMRKGSDPFGSTVTVAEGFAATIDLQGSGSSDPDGWTNSTKGVSPRGFCRWEIDDALGIADIIISRPATSAACNSSFNLPATAPSGNYTIKFLVTDSMGARSNTVSLTLTVLPDTIPPRVPAGLRATPGADCTEINLSWSPSTDAESGMKEYRIYRRVGATDTLIATVPHPTTSYTVPELTGNTNYTFVVSAVDNRTPTGNESAKSSPASATTATCPDTTAPSVPTNVAVSNATCGQLQITWTASTDNVAVAGYNIYRDGSATPLNSSLIAGTSYIDTSVTAGTPYSYRVQAVDISSNPSPLSAVALPGTPTACPDTTAPSVPTNVAVSNATCGQLQITWTASTDNVAVAGYNIYRDGILKGALISGTSYVDVAVVPGIPYAYAVEAVDTSSNVARSNAVSGTATICVASQPDLTISRAPRIRSGTTFEGFPIEFDGKIKNIGAASTGAPFTATFYLDVSNNGSLDVIISSQAVSALTSNAETEVISSKWTAVRGTHRVVLCADYSGLPKVAGPILESDETNNCSNTSVGQLGDDIIVVSQFQQF